MCTLSLSHILSFKLAVFEKLQYYIKCLIKHKRSFKTCKVDSSEAEKMYIFKSIFFLIATY